MTWFRRKPDPRLEKAEAASLEADETLAYAINMQGAVDEGRKQALSITQKLHQIRERNHFGESLEGLYREKNT